jgi:hypothetical protein
MANDEWRIVNGESLMPVRDLPNEGRHHSPFTMRDSRSPFAIHPIHDSDHGHVSAGRMRPTRPSGVETAGASRLHFASRNKFQNADES